MEIASSECKSFVESCKYICWDTTTAKRNRANRAKNKQKTTRNAHKNYRKITEISRNLYRKSTESEKKFSVGTLMIFNHIFFSKSDKPSASN